MKQYISIIILSLFGVLNSCDTRRDLFFEEKTPPTLFINPQGNNNGSNGYVSTIVDSFKLSNATLGQTYPINLKIADSFESESEIFVDGSFNGQFHLNSNIWDGNKTKITSDNILINYLPFNHGTHSFSLIITDKYEQKSSVEIILYVFQNLPPVATLEILNSQQLMSLERIISLNKSKDQDEKFGGKIIRYRYIVMHPNSWGNDTINTILPEINYIFPVIGQYTISGAVMDNDSIWNQKFLSVIIN